MSPELVQRYVEGDFSVHLHCTGRIQKSRDGVSERNVTNVCLSFQAGLQEGVSVGKLDDKTGPAEPAQDDMQCPVLVAVSEVTDAGELFTPGVPSVVRLKRIKGPLDVVACPGAEEWARGQAGLTVSPRLLGGLPGNPRVGRVSEIGYWVNVAEHDRQPGALPILSLRAGQVSPNGGDLIQCRLVLDDWNVWPYMRIRPDFLVKPPKVMRGPAQAKIYAVERV